MDDLNRKLEDILNDPESMEKVRKLAGSLLGEEDDKPESAEKGGSFEGADIGRIMNIISRVENRENDNRAKLLLALKPHLTAKRREKVDSAVKLLKLIEALPLLKEAGIFDLG
ncbi:MAG: hypothetical protein J5852_03260 [Clostridia bacterium]|nr:hypothetical protein [Clostridia bacterium]